VGKRLSNQDVHRTPNCEREMKGPTTLAPPAGQVHETGMGGRAREPLAQFQSQGIH